MSLICSLALYGTVYRRDWQLRNNGCGASPLVVSIQQGNTLTLCQNTSQVVNTLASGGVTPYSYSWSPTTNLSSGIVSSPIFTATTPGSFTYSVQVTDNNGQNQTASIQILVNATPGPAGFINGPDTVCSGSSGVLFSTSSSDATSYSWAMVPSGAGVISGNGSTTSIFFNTNFSGQATLTVAGVNACGTVTAVSKTIQVNPGTAILFNSISTPVCVSATPIQLIATPVGGIFTGAGVTGATFSSQIAGIGQHAISYTFQRAGGCSSFATQVVSVVNPPVVSITPSGPPPSAAADTITRQIELVNVALEEYSSPAVSIFPNPFKNTFVVKQEIRTAENVALYDVNYRKVDIQADTTPYGFIVRLPLDLANVVYLFYLTDESGNYHKYRLMRMAH